MSVPPTREERSITVPMLIIGFVAGVLTVVLVIRYFF